jgi:hypothetical protein
VDQTITVKGAQTENVTGLVHQIFKADHVQTVTGGQMVTAATHLLKAKDGITIQQTAGTFMMLINDITIRAEGKVEISRGEVAIKLEGGAATVSAADKISLMCGDSTITLASSGEISIKGSKIKLEAPEIAITGGTSVKVTGGGASKVELAAAGVVVGGPTVKLNA